MSKFKVGDKVIAKKHTPYMITTDGWTGVVTEVKKNGNFAARSKGFLSSEATFSGLYEAFFDLVSDDEKKIVIITDGVKTVTAKLYEGKRVIKTAEAKCSPEDKFDFNYGAALAAERLTDYAYAQFEKSVESIKEIANALCKGVNNNSSRKNIRK